MLWVGVGVAPLEFVGFVAVVEVEFEVAPDV